MNEFTEDSRNSLRGYMEKESGPEKRKQTMNF